MVAVSPVIKDNQMGSKNRQKLVHSAAHFLGTLTGTVRPPSIWKLKEFTELYACLNHLKLEPNDHRQEQIDCRIKTGLQSSHHLALYDLPANYPFHCGIGMNWMCQLAGRS